MMRSSNYFNITNVFSVFVFLIYGVTFAFIIFMIIRVISQNNKNNNSPILTVDAAVVTKHVSVSHHHSGVAGDITGAHGYHTTSFNHYNVTFQVESGDRMMFSVSANEYGMLAEGDIGRLTFQGTRFLDFQRL